MKLSTDDVNSQIRHLQGIYQEIFEIENIYSLDTISDFGPPQGGKRRNGMVSGGMGVYGTVKRVDPIGKLRAEMTKEEIREVYLCSVADRFAFDIYGKARTYGLDHHQSMLVLYLYESWRKEETNDQPFTLIYVCNYCMIEWEDTHDCACNDRCPQCNREIEPSDVIDWSEGEPCN